MTDEVSTQLEEAASTVQPRPVPFASIQDRGQLIRQRQHRRKIGLAGIASIAIIVPVGVMMMRDEPDNSRVADPAEQQTVDTVLRLNDVTINVPDQWQKLDASNCLPSNVVTAGTTSCSGTSSAPKLELGSPSVLMASSESPYGSQVVHHATVPRVVNNLEIEWSGVKCEATASDPTSESAPPTCKAWFAVSARDLVGIVHSANRTEVDSVIASLAAQA